MRQVAHALLTRPPLSHDHLHPEGICQKCFVRLACIKHAASVHPEPGSNSRFIFILSAPPKGSFNKIEFYLFALYLLKEFSWFAQIVQFVRCCSIFKVLSVRSLADSFNIIPHEHPFVNTFFSFFSLSFLRFLQISLSKMYILHKN